MVGLAIVIPRGGGSGPVLPDPLYTLGVDDYSHRYSGERLEGDAGDVITSWSDGVSNGSALMDASAGTVNPVLSEDATWGRYAKLLSDGTTPPSIQATFSTTSDTSGSIALVARMDPGDVLASTRNLLAWKGGSLGRASNDSWQYSINGGSVTYRVVGGPILADWFIIMASADGSAPWDQSHIVFSRNGHIITIGDTDTLGSAGRSSVLSFNVPITAGVEADILEVVTWDRALTQEEMGTVYTAMAAKYPFASTD